MIAVGNLGREIKLLWVLSEEKIIRPLLEINSK